MIAPCKVCRKPINDRTDVRWTMTGALLCSLTCLWKHRGKENLV